MAFVAEAASFRRSYGVEDLRIFPLPNPSLPRILLTGQPAGIQKRRELIGTMFTGQPHRAQCRVGKERGLQRDTEMSG